MNRLILAVIAMAFLSVSYAEARTLEEIVADLRVANDRQSTELSDVKTKLNWTWDELNKAESEVKQVALERDGWRDYGGQEHDKWMNAEKRVAEGKAGLLRRDLFIGILMVMIGVYAVLKFYFHVPFI